MLTRIVVAFVVAALPALAASAAGADPERHPVPNRCHPWAATVPADVVQRFESLGGEPTFGCLLAFDDAAYRFSSGAIMETPAYGAGTTYAVVFGADQVFHLYWNSNDNGRYDDWIVRLSFNHQLVNQVTYPATSEHVAADRGIDVLVHPSGRHGLFAVALEGCQAKFGVLSGNCHGWSTLHFDW